MLIWSSSTMAPWLMERTSYNFSPVCVALGPSDYMRCPALSEGFCSCSVFSRKVNEHFSAVSWDRFVFLDFSEQVLPCYLKKQVKQIKINTFLVYSSWLTHFMQTVANIELRQIFFILQQAVSKGADVRSFFPLLLVFDLS